MDMPSERVEKVKEGVREIFKENGNQPLSAVEILGLVRQELSNGQTADQETVGTALEQMLNRHELDSNTTGKIPKFNLKK